METNLPETEISKQIIYSPVRICLKLLFSLAIASSYTQIKKPHFTLKMREFGCV